MKNTWYLSPHPETVEPPRHYKAMYEQLNILVKTFNEAETRGYICSSNIEVAPGITANVFLEIEIYQRNCNTPLFREIENIWGSQSTPATIAQRFELLNFKIRTLCKL